MQLSLCNQCCAGRWRPGVSAHSSISFTGGLNASSKVRFSSLSQPTLAIVLMDICTKFGLQHGGRLSRACFLQAVALSLQRAWRGKKGREKAAILRATRLRRHGAAITTQQMWVSGQRYHTHGTSCCLDEIILHARRSIQCTRYGAGASPNTEIEESRGKPGIEIKENVRTDRIRIHHPW